MKKGKEVEHIYGFWVLGSWRWQQEEEERSTHPQLNGTNLAVLHLLEWKSIYIYQCTLFFLKNSLEGLTPRLAGSR
jgi:hypothetical protein